MNKQKKYDDLWLQYKNIITECIFFFLIRNPYLFLHWCCASNNAKDIFEMWTKALKKVKKVNLGGSVSCQQHNTQHAVSHVLDR